MRVARSAGILPKRSYYALLMEMNLIQPSARTKEQRVIADRYRAVCEKYLKELSLGEKSSVHTSASLRRLETIVYSKTVRQRE